MREKTSSAAFIYVSVVLYQKMSLHDTLLQESDFTR